MIVRKERKPKDHTEYLVLTDELDKLAWLDVRIKSTASRPSLRDLSGPSISVTLTCGPRRAYIESDGDGSNICLCESSLLRLVFTDILASLDPSSLTASR